MAIGCIHTEWLFRIHEKGGFTRARRLLDLGPQDVQTSRAFLRESIQRHLARDPAPDIAAIFTGDAPRRDCQHKYYSLFGIAEYASMDVDDDRADFAVDLNQPLAGAYRPYDVVTNFGTAEHVYDIARVFAAMHELLVPGGLALHCVPAFAFPNHGFYTPNPNLFIEFARFNGYELLDFSYVDNMFVRERVANTRAAGGIEFDALPIQASDMESTQHFMTKVVLQFHRNLMAPETAAVLRSLLPPEADPRPYPSPDYHMCFVFDLVFIAMIKPRVERPLVAPMQRMEGVAPLVSRPAAGP